MTSSSNINSHKQLTQNKSILTPSDAHIHTWSLFCTYTFDVLCGPLMCFEQICNHIAKIGQISKIKKWYRLKLCKNTLFYMFLSMVSFHFIIPNLCKISYLAIWRLTCLAGIQPVTVDRFNIDRCPSYWFPKLTISSSDAWSKTQPSAADHPHTAPKHCTCKNLRHHTPWISDICHQTPLNREHSSNKTWRQQKPFDMLQTTQREHHCEWVCSMGQPIQGSRIQNGGSSWQVPKIAELHLSNVGQTMQRRT